MVNLEANACGTPVITFRTEGSPEIIDGTTGSVVEKDDIYALEREIVRICSNMAFSCDACINRAKEFNMCKRFEEYICLYEDVIAESCMSDRRKYEKNCTV